jgi:hypothetical protein
VENGGKLHCYGYIKKNRKGMVVKCRNQIAKGQKKE